MVGKRGWCLWATLVVALCLLVGCDTFTPKVTGRVLDAETGQAVPAAEIRVSGQVYEADENGRYALYLGAGTFDLIFSSPAHVAQPVTITLRSTALLKRMDVKLTPRALLVTVNDAETSAPVPGATVQWGTLTAQTDDVGVASLRLAPGEALSVSAAGYRDATLEAAQLAVALAQDGDAVSVAVTLAPRKLAGRVLDAVSGEAVAGATLTCGEQKATSDATGAFTLVKLPPEGQLVVTAAGYKGPANLPYAGETQAVITIDPWVARVTVLDANSGAPVPEAMVTAGNHQALADAQGLAQVHAEPGAMLSVAADGYHGANVSFGGDPLTVSLEPSRLVVVCLSRHPSGQM